MKERRKQGTVLEKVEKLRMSSKLKVASGKGKKRKGNTGFQIKFGMTLRQAQGRQENHHNSLTIVYTMTEKKEMNGSNPSTIRHAHGRQAQDR